jgi:SAM-dependent methyltransferase
MKNAIVYSFHVREKDVSQNICYKQIRYSIDTLRKFNKDIPVYIHISPSSINTETLELNNNVYVIKFDTIDDGGWPEYWVNEGYLEFLKHRWENAIKTVIDYNLDNVLYLDTDTVFHKDPQILFNKYGSTNHLWAKPDNSNDLMSKVEVWPGMNDGQFIISKNVTNKDILNHMKFYVNHILSRHKEKLTFEEYRNLCWVSTQYSVWDYFQNNNNPVKYFDENEVMLNVEPQNKDTSNLILHHYYSGNTNKFVPNEYMSKTLKEISVSLGYPSDKDTSHNYLPVYQKEFDNINKIKMLEIGVYTGGSLKLWKDFFIDSEIHGIEDTKRNEEVMPGIMHWGKYEDLHYSFEDNYFDYIVNDSMHYAKEQIDAFSLYYSKLKPGGKFFMEDIPDMDNVSEIIKTLDGHTFKVWNMNKSSISKDSIILVVYKPF